MRSLIPALGTGEGGDPVQVSFWSILFRSRSAVAGMIIVLFVVIIATAGPLLTEDVRLSTRSFLPPTGEALLGTDDLGRDVLSQMTRGAGVSLLIGLSAALVSVVFGVIVGAISGFCGGFVDEALMRLAEVFQVIPQFFLAILIVALFGPSVFRIILVIAILSWPSTARITRAEYLKLRSLDFVQAARMGGISSVQLIFREILPNALPPVIVNASLLVASSILTETNLSFLGLGDPRRVSWGQMLYNAQPFLRSAWWTAAFPGLAILLTVLGFNLLGDGLNDVFNPRNRGDIK